MALLDKLYESAQLSTNWYNVTSDGQLNDITDIWSDNVDECCINIRSHYHIMTPNPGLADTTDTLIPLILISTMFYTAQGDTSGDLEQGRAGRPGQ